VHSRHTPLTHQPTAPLSKGDREQNKTFIRRGGQQMTTKKTLPEIPPSKGAKGDVLAMDTRAQQTYPAHAPANSTPLSKADREQNIYPPWRTTNDNNLQHLSRSRREMTTIYPPNQTLTSV
jgi:hypothetical protein